MKKGNKKDGALQPVSNKDLYRTKFNMHVMVTKRCNISCEYCYYPKVSAPDMPMEMVEDIVEQVRDLDQNIFYDLSGGEPLLHPNIFEIIELVLPEGKEILINTNGTLINDKVAKKFKDYQEGYNFFPVISLDSHKEEIHNITRSNYSKVIRAFETMKDNGAKFAVDVTLSAINNPYILDTIRFLAENYTRDIVVCKLRPVFDVKNKGMFLSDKEIVKTYLKIHELEQEYGFNFYRSLNDTGEDFCTAGIDKISIGYDGSVFPCYMLENMVIGNVRDASLKTLVDLCREATEGKGRDCIICETEEYSKMRSK